MTIDLRLPNITGGTAETQIKQMQSWMFQIVEQLNIALQAVSDAQEGKTETVEVKGTGVTSGSAAAEKTFNSIKALIIKSAEIVQAYYDEMKTKYDGEYVAQSDFGTYEQQVSQEITQNAEGISQIFSNIQEITTDVTDLENALINSQAWINTGLLEYDQQGAPVYGLEVGQRTTSGGVEVFNKYARFTASGIYFYLPGAATAVAWMTGTKLYITNAEITNTLKLGNFIVDLTNGLTIKWAGG